MNNIFVILNLRSQSFNKNSLNLDYSHKGSLSVGVITMCIKQIVFWNVLYGCSTYFFHPVIT
jgi:hypothetical protein